MQTLRESSVPVDQYTGEGGKGQSESTTLTLQPVSEWLRLHRPFDRTGVFLFVFGFGFLKRIKIHNMHGVFVHLAKCAKFRHVLPLTKRQKDTQIWKQNKMVKPFNVCKVNVT